MARYIMSLNSGGKPNIALERRRIGVNLLFTDVYEVVFLQQQLCLSHKQVRIHYINPQ